MESMSRVLLVDDNPLFRLGLRELVKTMQPTMEVVEVDSFTAARALLRAGPDVALIMLDMQLPDCGGFMGLFKLRTEFPEIPVIIFSTSADSESVSRALASGAAGYISKSSSCDVISRALAATLSNKSWTPVPIFAGENQVNPIAALSPAQLRVLNGLKRGLRNKEIAFELGLSEKTIKAYLSMLYRKLGVSSRTQALILLQEVLVDSHPQPAP
jgi:DNA-binding NarL/FixJ family response regulator